LQEGDEPTRRRGNEPMSRRSRNVVGFSRYQPKIGAGPALLILISLADGPKHGYAMTQAPYDRS
jgi:hypothetical protein